MRRTPCPHRRATHCAQPASSEDLLPCWGSRSFALTLKQRHGRRDKRPKQRHCRHDEGWQGAAPAARRPGAAFQRRIRRFRVRPGGPAIGGGRAAPHQLRRDAAAGASVRVRLALVSALPGCTACRTCTFKVMTWVHRARPWTSCAAAHSCPQQMFVRFELLILVVLLRPAPSTASSEVRVLGVVASTRDASC